MHQTNLAVGQNSPRLSWPGARWRVCRARGREGWRMLVVYGAGSCCLCGCGLKSLKEGARAFEAEKIETFPLCADTRARTLANVQKSGWISPVGWGLALRARCRLGLLVSAPRTSAERAVPSLSQARS